MPSWPTWPPLYRWSGSLNMSYIKCLLFLNKKDKIDLLFVNFVQLETYSSIFLRPISCQRVTLNVARWAFNEEFE